MTDPVHQLYQSRAYPAMSHPRTDPAVTVVAARLAGLDAPDPSRASILEIGCASGLNLLPLAARWPDARFTGIDLSARAVAAARELALNAGLDNIGFVETDLLDFDPGDEARYDFIICHGIYSWVPEAVRQALPGFCAARLTPGGSAMISYNTLPGWSLRKSIVDLTKALAEETRTTGFPGGAEPVLAELLMAANTRTAYGRHLGQVLHDILGQGGDFLVFDDFGPVNEPRTFLDFTAHAESAGLRYLGESLPSEDYPASLPPEAPEILGNLTSDPRLLQQSIDLLVNRTFRHSLLCRADAPVFRRPEASTLVKCGVRCPHQVIPEPCGVRIVNNAGEEMARVDEPLGRAFFQALSQSRAETPPFHEVVVHMAEWLDAPLKLETDIPRLAAVALDAARRNLVALRGEPVRFDPSPPAMPDLGKLRLSCARAGLPIVDPYHVPCLLDDESKRQLAGAMDGSRTIGELEMLARSLDPEFRIGAWIRHLAARGMFVG